MHPWNKFANIATTCEVAEIEPYCEEAEPVECDTDNDIFNLMDGDTTVDIYHASGHKVATLIGDAPEYAATSYGIYYARSGNTGQKIEISVIQQYLLCGECIFSCAPLFCVVTISGNVQVRRRDCVMRMQAEVRNFAASK